jgi:hypothetical protein
MHFNATMSTDEKGRIVVTLPFKCSQDMISNTRPIATCRFYWLEKKFEREPVFAKKYREFMDNYIKAPYDTHTLIRTRQAPASIFSQ